MAPCSSSVSLLQPLHSSSASQLLLLPALVASFSPLQPLAELQQPLLLDAVRVLPAGADDRSLFPLDDPAAIALFQLPFGLESWLDFQLLQPDLCLAALFAFSLLP